MPDRAPLIAGFEIDLDRAVEIIRRGAVRRVGIQVPEGLKRAAPAMAREIRDRTGAEVIISGDPCYGACDLDLELCRAVDLMVHVGHASLCREGEEKVIYLEARMPEDLGEAARRAVPHLRSRRVGLATTVQHAHRLDQAKEALSELGIEARVGEPCRRTRYRGQVLGCCYCAAKDLDADEFLFLGTGQFHPLGIALATGKRVVASDPISREVREIDPQPMLRRRYGAIARANDAKTIAVLVSKKPGQRRMDVAQRMMVLGQEKGKDMILVYLDNVEPDRLLNLGAQAAVCTACPRIALDDMSKYRIPVLTPPEFEVLLGMRRWEDYVFDEIE
ncbi:MAG: diphthamide biosynthesis enzyme Dph2 [Methanosarcinales archaeon]|nr:diphthamide biosynthesis enzyme Dph2 [Methanosarcinales archaeon]